MSGLHKVRLVTFGTQTRIYLDDQAKYGVHRFWGDRRINIGFDDRRPIILRGKSCIGIRVENNGEGERDIGGGRMWHCVDSVSFHCVTNN